MATKSFYSQKLTLLDPSKQKPKETARTSQKQILSNAVKRKSQTPLQEPPEKQPQFVRIIRPSAMKAVAILPGIGDYKSSDESDGSSDLDEFVGGSLMDLTGRQLIKKKSCDE